MRPVLYLYRSCSSCREAEVLLREHRVDLEVREFFKEPFTEGELRDVLGRAGMQPSELVSRRSKVFRDQSLGALELSEDEWIGRMLEEPTLIRRPILVTDEEVVVGFNRKTYESMAEGIEGAQD